MRKLSINLEKFEELTLSSIMRELNKKSDKDAYFFLRIYKKIFDQCFIKDIKKCDEIALKKTIDFLIKKGSIDAPNR